jgi:hypothetical protein
LDDGLVRPINQQLLAVGTKNPLTWSKQVEMYRNTAIPILFTEYGGQSRTSRTFHDTPILYSPTMTSVFSGGCVYEFWKGVNDYGLVLLELNNPKVPIGEPGNPSRHRGLNAVAETRQIDSGTLYIFRDFLNYKQRLAETRNLVASADDAPELIHGVDNWMDCLFGHKPSDDVVPESCVDWEGVERGVGVV